MFLYYKGPFFYSNFYSDSVVAGSWKRSQLGYRSFLPTITIDFLLPKLKSVRREAPNNN